MTLFDHTRLPRPHCLRRRHLALVLLAECLSDHHAAFSAPSPRRLRWEDGGGNDYGLILAPGGEAVVWVFSHESEYSPWGVPGEPQDYPGMLDGLPPHLAAHLPQEQPRSITGCWWFVHGAWRRGDPAPPDIHEDLAQHEAQGGHLLRPLLVSAPCEDALWLYDEPSRRAAADALVARVDEGLPVTREAIVALDPIPGVETAFQRARALGI